jgi:hypothetical protein
METLRAYYHQHPLRSILWGALFFRLISVLFSEGYGFSDDHFLVVEVAQQWVDGVDPRNWMPWNGNATPSGHSLFYPGLHYFFFASCKSFGIENPAIKMLLVRLLHALYSLTIVLLSYKIVRKISGEHLAAKVGWLIALLWFMPFFSVRNMVEIVCIPPLLYATLLILKATDSEKLIVFFFSGIIAGLAFSFRFQTITFIGGFGLALLIRKQILPALAWGVGALLCMVLLQGGIDYYIWGRPFAEFKEYTIYNIENAHNYILGDWYNYLLLVSGLLVPPLGVIIWFGMYKVRKEYLLIILPALCFFLFHSYFPNKQERFILPVIPFFVMAGLAGWQQIVISAFWQQKASWLKAGRVFFITVNGILLLALTPSSTKTTRVHAMSYLHDHTQANSFILELSHQKNGVLMPKFYWGKWNDHVVVTEGESATKVIDTLKANGQVLPDYVIFGENVNLENRINTFKNSVKSINYETTIEPSILDQVMHWLNPVNVNQTYYIYRVQY